MAATRSETAPVAGCGERGGRSRCCLGAGSRAEAADVGGAGAAHASSAAGGAAASAGIKAEVVQLKCLP
jgi:hypothetical protein